MKGSIIKTKKHITLQGEEEIPQGTEGFIYGDKRVGENVYKCIFRNGVFAYLNIKDLEVINNFENNFMQKLTTSLKRVLSKPLQLQFKAGIRNNNLELTEKGRQELLEILAVEKEKELTDVAKEIISENDQL